MAAARIAQALAGSSRCQPRLHAPCALTALGRSGRRCAFSCERSSTRLISGRSGPRLTPHAASSSAKQTGDAAAAVEALLRACEGTERGLATSPQQRDAILAAVARLKELGSGQATTDDARIDATWELVWTTEKETLFILKNAGLFRTAAGAVYQVIDTAGGRLQNVITFKNLAFFAVDSSLRRAGPQRLNFEFTGARLALPARTWRLPPFGKGWFDTLYLDGQLRVAQDVRGDTLVVRRAGPPREF